MPGVKGIDPKELEIEAVALYSDVAQHGGFHCSDEMLNKLQSNITWSAKSNFCGHSHRLPPARRAHGLDR